MKKQKNKLQKTIEKHEAIIEDMTKAKTDALVKARRGEFWIQNNQEEYNNVVDHYTLVRSKIKKMCEIRRHPFWVHVIAHCHMFVSGPIAYFTIRPKAREALLDAYWAFKQIKKEWEEDFDFTEKQIDKEFLFVKHTEQFIENQKQFLERGKKILEKIERNENDKNKKI